jgi:hypothetical protein
MNHLIKICLMAAMLAVIFIFSQSYSKGGTNKIGNQVIAAINTPTTNRLSWLVNLSTQEGVTNADGLSCNLRIENNQGIPFCTVYINNKSTNIFLKCWVVYQDSYLKIDLLDSEGRPVEKTEAGKLCGNLPSQQQLRELALKRNQEHSLGRFRTDGFRPILAMANNQISTSFDLSDLFELKQAGKYTLQMQMPLIQNPNVFDTNSDFKITWLPEVTAKIQIRSGDIPK